MKSVRVFAIILMVFSLASGNSQTPNDSPAPTPDFVGSWKLDRELSSNHPTLSPSRFDELSFVISQNDSILKVTRTMKTKNKERAQELIYYADGRGEENPTMFGSQKRKSKTFWSDGKLVSKYTLSLWASSANEYYNQEARDIWEISKDMNTLTIVTELSEVRNLPDFLRDVFKPETYRKVFKKVR